MSNNDKQELDELAYDLLEILSENEPALAVGAVTVAFGNALICSTPDQDLALERLSKCVEAITEMFENYEQSKHCHWLRKP
jgi:hypothetical protein